MSKFCCANNHGSLCSACKSDINSIAVSRIWRETNDSGHCSIALSQFFSISNTKLSSLKPKGGAVSRIWRETNDSGHCSIALSQFFSISNTKLSSLKPKGGGGSPRLKSTQKLCVCMEDHEMRQYQQNQKGPTPLIWLGPTLKSFLSHSTSVFFVNHTVVPS